MFCTLERHGKVTSNARLQWTLSWLPDMEITGSEIYESIIMEVKFNLSLTAQRPVDGMSHQS